MAEQSALVPFLSGEVEGYVCCKNTPFLVTSAKWVLKVAIWVIFFSWATFLFLYPLEFVQNFYEKWSNATSGTLYGEPGSIFLLFSGPILIITFLAIMYLIISGEEDIQQNKTQKKARFRLSTFPVIIDGPFGVVSAAELIGILLFSVYIIWTVSFYIQQNLSSLSGSTLSFEEKLSSMLKQTGVKFGYIGIFCLAFLFLPISRGSVLLRYIDIPFEHATRYHIWLGHLTIWMFALHGMCYVILWTMHHHLITKLLEWKNHKNAILPGVISLSAGLLMWVTSLSQVRRRTFELFFYTHQLYIVFVVFMALHVGDYSFSMVAAAIFLYMLDRFLRFCQSRRTVDILSARCLPCGTVELVLSKPASLRYNALSWIFLQVRQVSWLQWHPFSVSSSPQGGKYHLSILVKVLGGWSHKLRERIVNVSGEGFQNEPLLQPHLNIKASIEGPYGHESPYYLTYENLILVAGGIGISPFLAILTDILHRINAHKPYPPKNILIVWTVKKSKEIPLLHAIDLESICPDFCNTLNLEIQTYVTRESEPSLEEGKVQKSVRPSDFSASKEHSMSGLVGTGNIVWSGIYVMVSTIGLVISMALIDVYYINPYNITYWWYKGLLLLACMTTSVMLFGGVVIVLWCVCEKRVSAREEYEMKGSMQPNEQPPPDEKDSHYNFLSSTVQYGQRPDIEEIFGSMSQRLGNVDIGVIACGPPALSTRVAKECRRLNFSRSSSYSSIFHFHSHSFDL